MGVTHIAEHVVGQASEFLVRLETHSKHLKLIRMGVLLCLPTDARL